MGVLVSVNVSVPRLNPAKDRVRITGIDKRPVNGPVALRAPASSDEELLERALYAYTREDLDAWATELGRDLTGGNFGEDLTTSGLDVNDALIGERWRIGGDVIVEVTKPRIPCATFAAWMGEPQWVKRFTDRAAPGSYLRIVESGEVRAGDPITVLHRPDHDVTVELTFRALTIEPELLPRLLAVPTLSAEVRDKVLRRQ